ncbi:hypothetical protein DOM22_00655 [Bdellovibrio sp. ZAP7]|jgi:hypothetical protein|uniref:hypothetical protein n=1 Tax=Bdellovibrio sp. ZAP7 TaxID=2231053 RepID=UPI0011571400|nr:hypothetical protein [Bdellovibrio sp. ZAP7]QDK43779.1 hypothetical protein DOM22_00655 [Bdellovibrio sp. ZAP7]
MTIEYVLLMIAILGIGLKAFLSAPSEAFRGSGPRLAARVERQLDTGQGFKENGARLEWSAVK